MKYDRSRLCIFLGSPGPPIWQTHRCHRSTFFMAPLPACPWPRAPTSDSSADVAFPPAERFVFELAKTCKNQSPPRKNCPKKPHSFGGFSSTGSLGQRPTPTAGGPYLRTDPSDTRCYDTSASARSHVDASRNAAQVRSVLPAI